MRLTHLKLAGFKSFVDPTTLHIHGNRVGIVGPNGCGKSNIMEAVRWVLGESSAREMRGESMQDVVFNGSANRKPVSRASVELHFDNTLGGLGNGISGEWGQYAEIAIKRVLERDSGSAYFINNTQVRRRDVADLFLGTGLGSRAYSIIGQNTISRIVEAKPEELRVFLEEAAGISKYKERRRETESRLRDTHENLERVSDIRSELAKQIARLLSQAEVAAEYHRLRQALKVTQCQLWLLKKRVAAADWEKTKRQVERLANELEAQIAQQRKIESEIERLRQTHYACTEAVQQAQGRYYETNAQVTTLEQQLRHNQEKRDRLNAQLAQINAQMEKLGDQQQARQTELVALADSCGNALSHEQATAALLETSRAVIPQLEQAQLAAQQEFFDCRERLTQTEQALQLDTAHLQHLRRTLADMQQRRQKLTDEISGLCLPEPSQIELSQAELEYAENALQAIETEIAQLQQRVQESNTGVRQLQLAENEQSRVVAQLEAQRSTLQKIQLSHGQEAKLESWVRQHGLEGKRRFWECLKVAQGWETAVESVLGVRINAVLADDVGALSNITRPPLAVVFCDGQRGAGTPRKTHERTPLLAYLDMAEPYPDAVLEDWFAGVCVLEDGEDAAIVRRSLDPGEMLVNRVGDIFTRHSFSFHAPQSALHGVLERQRELAEIECSLPQTETGQQRLQAELVEAEQLLNGLRLQLAEKQQEQRRNVGAVTTLRLGLQRLQQQQQHGNERLQQLQMEQKEAAVQIAELEIQASQGEGALLVHRDRLIAVRAECGVLQQVCTSAEQALAEARSETSHAERKAQQAKFDREIVEHKIKDLGGSLGSLQESHTALLAQRGEFEAVLAAEVGEISRVALEQALEAKHSREQELAETRNHMSETEQQLQDQERNRLQIEHELQPLRSKLEQGRLQEQQARLHFDYCSTELAARGGEQEALGQGLPAAAKPALLELQAAEIEAQTEQLGPVNLAAMQELESERERDAYLGSQAQDLAEAVETLKDAIRRIDRETRGRLQQTFDEANRQFGELFGVLFAGGHARLELLGEEILDTGIQVFAQPPGKKNTTIHLLSGGEKALTAIALVFALFKLNPAPFCLMDEVDAPLDDSNTDRFCAMVKKMSAQTQFLFVSHNKITMEMAQQLIGVTMQESGVSRIVEVDIDVAMRDLFKGSQDYE